MEILHLFKHITNFNLFLHTILILFLCKYDVRCDDRLSLNGRALPAPDNTFIGQNISLVPEQLFRLLVDAEYIEARNRALGLNAPPINLFDAINQFAELSGNVETKASVEPVFPPAIQMPPQRLVTHKKITYKSPTNVKKKLSGKSGELIGKNLTPIKRNDYNLEPLLRQMINRRLIKPTLTERGSVTDWLQKLSAYMFKQLRNLIMPLRDTTEPNNIPDASHQQTNQPLPQSSAPVPYAHHMFPPSHMPPFNPLYPQANDIHAQESESVYHSFANSAANNLQFVGAPQPVQYFEDHDIEDADHINLAPENHLNSDGQDYLPHHHHPYNPEQYKPDDEHTVEDTRVGHTFSDLPLYTEDDDNRHYQQQNSGSNSDSNHQSNQSPYQSYQHQNQHQLNKNSKESSQTSSSNVRLEYINTHNDKNDNYRYARSHNHYHNNRNNNHRNHNHNHDDNNNANMGQNSNSELVIPLYTDVRINHQSNGERATYQRQQHPHQHPHHIVRSASQLRPIVHNIPQQPIQYIIHDNQIETEECKEEPFKPLVTATQSQSDEPKRGLSRKKRYIDYDYSQLQLRKIPIWFPRRNGIDNTVAASSDAIVEIKPRSLFRWRQPMQGWKPIIPPEDERKNIFLKRSGSDSTDEQTSDLWDHEKVESHTYFQWQQMPDENVESIANGKVVDDLKTSESRITPKLEDLFKHTPQAENNGQKRVQRKVFITDYSKHIKPQEQYNDFSENKYSAETLVDDAPQTTVNSNVVTVQNTNTDKYVVEDVKAVEIKHLPDITKAKGLREISEIPGAVIRPIDPKLTDILLRILNQNTDFASKRITNAYFLEFPKAIEYKPKSAQNLDQNIAANTETVTSKTTKSDDIKLEIDDEDDVPMNESDFEYGQQICSDKYSGSYADVRKDCRLYYTCTETTVDTYVCPKGTRFDAITQYCRSYYDVVCGP